MKTAKTLANTVCSPKHLNQENNRAVFATAVVQLRWDPWGTHTSCQLAEGEAEKK